MGCLDLGQPFCDHEGSHPEDKINTEGSSKTERIWVCDDILESSGAPLPPPSLEVAPIMCDHEFSHYLRLLSVRCY